MSKQRFRVSENESKFGYQYRGQRFCNDTLVRPIKLSWVKKDAPRPPYTTVRIVPGLNPDDDYMTMDATRLDDGDLGDFIRCYQAWRGGGDPGCTFFTHDPMAAGADDYDKFQNPAMLLYTAVKRAVSRDKDHPEWEYLITKHKDPQTQKIVFPLIVPVKDMYLVRAVLYRHNEIDVGDVPYGLGEDDLLALVDLGSGAGKDLKKMIMQQHEDDQTNVVSYTLTDPIGLDSDYARFFTFWPTEVGPPPAEIETGASRSRSRATVTTASTDSDKMGFGITVEKRCGKEVPAFSAEDQAIIRKKLRPWEDILKFPTVDEQAAMLRAAIPRLDVLEYAWRDHPEWLPNDCPHLERLRNRVTSGYRTPSEADGAPARGTLGRRGTQPTADPHAGMSEAEQEAEAWAQAQVDGPIADEPVEQPAPRTRTRAPAPQVEEPSDAPARTRNRSRATDAALSTRELPPVEETPSAARTRTRTTANRSALSDAQAAMG